MTAGLPGTGIGGLFYLLSVIVMVLYEIIGTARGRSTKKRWKIVLQQSGIAFGMIVAALLTDVFLSWLIFDAHTASSVSSSHKGFQIKPIMIPLLILMVVTSAVWLSGIIVGKQKSS